MKDTIQGYLFNYDMRERDLKRQCCWMLVLIEADRRTIVGWQDDHSYSISSLVHVLITRQSIRAAVDIAVDMICMSVHPLRQFDCIKNNDSNTMVPVMAAAEVLVTEVAVAEIAAVGVVVRG